MFNIMPHIILSATPPTALGLEKVLAGGETLLDLGVLCWNFCVSNPYLAVIVAASIFGLAFKLISRGKKAVF